MNWVNEEPKLHRVVLYNSDPTISKDATVILNIDTAHQKDGFFVTEIQLEKVASNDLG